MGKRVKKKAAHSAHKENRVSTFSPKTVSQEDNQSSVVSGDGSVVQKERKVCVHLEKAVDVGRVSSQIELAESIGCEYCRENVNDRKAGKGKGKHGKKKGASESRAEFKATWVCLQCGHFSCGGVGLPTSPQFHAVKHARQTRHPLVIQLENPQLRWCFSCSTLLTVDKLEDTSEQKNALLDIVKLLKKQSAKVPTVDVEDIWFGSGSVISEVKTESKAVNVANGKDFYAVRGLINLGNTCFFNSVLQNLLAMDVLRDYLLKLEGSMGAFSSALKKLLIETDPGSGLRNVINPKPLFGCVVAKAPQFRGYEQQDSHELLRYLLDGLSSEDLHAKKSGGSSPENGRSLLGSAPYVDAIFGGQTSSTVSCVECGNSSVVYEPFLDLSLPVPMKKPPSKKAQPVPRTKKTKPPPKRGGRTRSKLTKNGDLGPAPSACNTSSTTKSSSDLKSDSLSCSPSEDLVESSTMVHGGAFVIPDSNLTREGHASSQLPESDAQVDATPWLDYVEPVSQGNGVQEADSFAWLDYLEPMSLSDEPNLFVENENSSVTQHLGSCDDNQGTVTLQYTANSSPEASLSQDSGMKGDIHYAVSVPNTANSGAEVQNNEILLLTYKEDGAMEGEVTKLDADIGGGEDTLGFGGLADLFNEPEAVEGGVKNIQVNEHVGNGFLVGSNSESDPDEVDDTNSPVSVESCLAHFTKPELLSGEHAWDCENCSKLLKEGRQKVRKNQHKTDVMQKISSSDECSSSEKVQASTPISDSSHIFLATHNNGNSDTDENLKRLGARQINGLCLNLPPEDKEKCVQETAHLNDSGAGIFFGPSNETNLECKSLDGSALYDNDVAVERPIGLSEEHASREDEEEETDLKCVKAMRDATKRILISKTPPILTIHLKRFGQDARGRLNKLNGHVGFKEFLDLGPYMDHRSTERDNCIYHLIGVVEHSGTMKKGHYVAYVRGGDRRRRGSEEENRQAHSVWYLASDTSVRETTLEEVLHSEAYILFYEKVKL
ncbi:ubiquitin carboxyl-terminal hydrolase 2 isoform X2 [Beta vulgaris subsp. vulgaris]|uniref:ubiquitin carboxyl-terminal hydrolase 2 isoform X2 n=1 Tax=Beta vulgaris subsp. vulgaris TaxID=3555 RepID=UPI00203694A5|nr:ubiquitin carboxyl-terminal hydrolase 2 isoform X2 [Beta vulgaris subsp. vulgaris]